MNVHSLWINTKRHIIIHCILCLTSYMNISIRHELTLICNDMYNCLLHPIKDTNALNVYLSMNDHSQIFACSITHHLHTFHHMYRYRYMHTYSAGSSTSYVDLYRDMCIEHEYTYIIIHIQI